MFLCTFKYLPEHVDCKLCTEYEVGTGCTSPGCPWLAERIEAGVVGYKEALTETFGQYRILRRRLTSLIRHFPGTLWLNADHQQRMNRLNAYLGYRRHRDTPAYYAAMYLLTSSRDIYSCTANCFCKQGFESGYARVRGISPHDYALLAAAKVIYTGADSITVEDLADTEIVDPVAFRLIINAVLIARYGVAALKLKDGRRTA